VLKRSKVDWALEAIALAAALAVIVLTAIYAPQIAARPRFGTLRSTGLPVVTTLWAVAGIDLLAYIGLTLGSRGRGLFHIPEALDREAPHVRQMLFSMMIVMKAVLALFGLYLVWTLVKMGLRLESEVSGRFLTIFTLAVPIPLILYTVKLRRYSK
jgi:hypothetical protein